MTSWIKSIVHTAATAAAFWLPMAITHYPVFNESVGTILTHIAPFLTLSGGAVISLALNYLISHTIPTTTGASAIQ